MTGPANSSSLPRTRAALDELGRMLLSEHTTPSVLQRIAELAARAMPAGTEVSITLVRGDRPTTAAFTDDDRSALAECAVVAGAVLTNMDALHDARELAENLQKAMEFRSVIEQAKGILVERYKLTAQQAFRVLADASMHTNRKLRDLAEDLVLTGELPTAPRSRRPPPAAGT